MRPRSDFEIVAAGASTMCTARLLSRPGHEPRKLGLGVFEDESGDVLKNIKQAN